MARSAAGSGIENEKAQSFGRVFSDGNLFRSAKSVTLREWFLNSHVCQE
jgi:hypothetical protein